MTMASFTPMFELHPERNSNLIERVIIFLSIGLLFLPKINILAFSGTFLRMDDVILCVLTICSTLYYLQCSKARIIDRFAFYIIAIQVVSILSLIVNQSKFDSWLFMLKPVTYLSTIFAGVIIARRSYSISGICLFIIALNFVIILTQFLGVVGGFLNGVYHESVAERPVGLYSGPWECACIVGMAIPVVLANTHNYLNRFLIVGIGIVVCLICQSRVGFLALCIVSPLLLLGHSRVTKIMWASLPLTIVLGLFVALTLPRSEGLDIGHMGEVISAITTNRDTLGDDVKIIIDNETVITDSGDPSLDFRIIKWAFVLSDVTSSIHGFFLGFSPGAFGFAVDGSFVRILGELGILGIICYILLFMFAFNVDRLMRCIVIVLIVNSVLIDTLYSSRVMPFFFLLLGYAMTMVNTHNNYFIIEKNNR